MVSVQCDAFGVSAIVTLRMSLCKVILTCCKEKHVNDKDNDNDTHRKVQPTSVSGLTGVSEGVMTPRKEVS